MALAACRLALEHGVDAIEIDLRLTRDGMPVALHDATLRRTTRADGALAEWPAARVAMLDATAPPFFTARVRSRLGRPMSDPCSTFTTNSPSRSGRASAKAAARAAVALPVAGSSGTPASGANIRPSNPPSGVRPPQR